MCNELTKLKLVLKGSKVSSEDIEKHIGISKEYNIFELQNALGTKDIEKATELLITLRQILRIIHGMVAPIY